MSSARPRKKTRIEDVRRTELIEAAHRVFLESGLTGLTTTRICREAGMSQGILTYYFKGKDAVLFEMVRHANRILMEEVVTRLKSAETGWDRLLAVIEGNFPATRYDGNTANAWISFYAAAASNMRYRRLQNLFYRRLYSNVASAVDTVLTRAELDMLVRGLAAIIDGLWLRRGQDEGLGREEAVALVRTYVEQALGQDRLRQLREHRTKGPQ